MALVRLERIVKRYDTDAAVIDARPVLKGTSFEIAAGEFVAIMGPSGSGKSTLMNILGCLDVPTEGRYLLDGTDVGSLSADALAALRSRAIGFVFQGFNLLKRVSLVDNVALPLVYAGVPAEARRATARQLLERVGLAAHLGKQPNQISGGQQQRVAIARALANRPRLILADEPTGNLDSETSREVMELFAALNRDEGITIVLVTHEADVAAWARRLIRLVDGQVVYDGPPAAATH